MTQTGPAVDRNLMRDMNKRTLFNLIRTQGPVSRTVLCEFSGLSMGTVATLTNSLIENGLIMETGVAESTGGRKSSLLAVQPRGAYAIGLYPAERLLEGVIMDLNGQPVFSKRWEINLHGSSFEGLNQLVLKTNELIEQSGLERDRIIGVGCGLPGTVNPETGYCIDSWHFGWHNVPVRELLAERLNLPVFVDNVINCLAFFELVFNRGRTNQHFLVVAVGGRGLGLVIVNKGTLYRGAWGSGAEFGHTIYQVNGRQCECGNKGCLEEYVVDRGILANYRELQPVKAVNKFDHTIPIEAQIEILLEQARSGDEPSTIAFEQSGTSLGVGLANLVNLFSPECIVLSFERFEIKDFLLEPIRNALQENTFSQLGKKLKLVVEPLNKSDWARGAGSIALSHFFASPFSATNVWGTNLIRLKEPFDAKSTSKSRAG